jgi:hypothetical protein
MAQAMGMGIMPWSPLKHGFLSGKFRRDNGSVDTKRTAMGVPGEKDHVVIDALCAAGARLKGQQPGSGPPSGHLSRALTSIRLQSRSRPLRQGTPMASGDRQLWESPVAQKLRAASS